jgi:hypothetical protein
MKKSIINFGSTIKYLVILSFFTSCKNSKFAHIIGSDKKELVTNQKKFSESSDNEKLLGCWTTAPEKSMPDGKSFGERQVENTEILIFFKDSSFASATIVGSAISQNSNPYVSYLYGYSVSNDIIKYKNSEGLETSKPIKINENTIEFWDKTYTRGNCAE